MLLSFILNVKNSFHRVHVLTLASHLLYSFLTLMFFREPKASIHGSGDVEDSRLLHLFGADSDSSGA